MLSVIVLSVMMLSVIMLSVIMLSVIMLSVIMLSVMLSVIKLSVIKLSVITLSVVAPFLWKSLICTKLDLIKKHNNFYNEWNLFIFNKSCGFVFVFKFENKHLDHQCFCSRL